VEKMKEYKVLQLLFIDSEVTTGLKGLGDEIKKKCFSISYMQSLYY